MNYESDDFTPFGYLNIPQHTARLSPRGVLRSQGVGFSWHSPAFSGGYGGQTEHFSITLGISDSPDRWTCDYHTSNLVRLRGTVGDVEVTAEFFVVDEHAWAMRLDAERAVRVDVIASYRRTLSAAGQWGESGLLARAGEAGLVIQSFEDGDAFVFGGPADWTLPEPPRTVGSRLDSVRLVVPGRVALGAGTVLLTCARGATAPRAEATARAAWREAASARTRLLDADRDFWAGAPELTGDWPAHWRRGLVYDLETLRMMIKDPIGDYAAPWDGMQIQAPRYVLGEAAMDALALSWADPDLAATAFAGGFLNADARNLPCSREDGTHNMVSAEGLACGTGPQWGYPLLVAERLRTIGGPKYGPSIEQLTDYLEFWWEERRRPHLAFACSWESGQDESPRFGEHAWGGGTPTWHVEPVDLVASMLHAANALARMAEAEGAPEPAVCESVRAHCLQRLGAMRTGQRYVDLDHGRTPTGQRDVMHLAPWALGVAEPSEAALDEVRSYSVEALHWPMFVWTAVLAHAGLGDLDGAAAMAAAVVDRAYASWDRRVVADGETLPGVACEYWPLTNRCAGEGYGWGAFGVELLLTHVLGVERIGSRWSMCPRLPFRSGRFMIALGPASARAEVCLSPQGDRLEVEWGGNAFTVPVGSRFGPEGVLP